MKQRTLKSLLTLTLALLIMLSAASIVLATEDIDLEQDTGNNVTTIFEDIIIEDSYDDIYDEYVKTEDVYYDYEICYEDVIEITSVYYADEDTNDK